MPKNQLILLMQYNFWANGRILATCAQLSWDVFTRPVQPDPGWGNLRAILIHTLDTEMGWRHHLQAHEEDTILQEANFTDFAMLKAQWQAEQQAWHNYLTELPPEDIHTTPAGGHLTIWQTILHVIMHSAQHRSEAATILTSHGRSPGELDFDVFLRQNATHV